MQKIPFKKFLPGIVWFLIVLILTCMPGKDVPEISWLDGIYFDKWVHAGMFGGLTLLFSWAFFKSNFSEKQRLHYFIKIAIAASIWGLAIEFIQKFYAINRDFDILDWAADSFGALVAFLFAKKYLLPTPF